VRVWDQTIAAPARQTYLHNRTLGVTTTTMTKSSFDSIGSPDRVYERLSRPARWSIGRVTLIGDAAHALVPPHGRGANQSIEDAVVLAAQERNARLGARDSVMHHLGVDSRFRRPHERAE